MKTTDLAFAQLNTEVVRQDAVHPAGYPGTRDGIFLGIQTAVHELDVEAMQAWRDGRQREDWMAVRGELIQAAAVIMRTVRSIDMVTTSRHMDEWVRGQVTHRGEEL